MDAGCAGGYFLDRLRERGYTNLAGADANVYEKISHRVERVNLSYEPLPWPDGSLDGVTAWEVVEHLENPYFFIREAARVLAPEGMFFFSMPNALHLENRLLFFRRGEFWRWNEKNDHRTILTPGVFYKTIAPYFQVAEITYPIPLLAKHGFLGRVAWRFPFLKRLLPENSWFGYFVLYALQKNDA